MKIWVVRMLGWAIIAYFGYLIIGKQWLMPTIGVCTEGVVSGFKAKGNLTPVERSYDKNLWSARTPYVRFLPPQAADSVTVLCDGNAFFSLLNYSKGDIVKVAYWKDAPQSATLIGWRAYPLSLFMLAIGAIIALGKAPIQKI